MEAKSLTGFTLLEIVIVLALFSIISVTTLSLLMSGRDTYSSGLTLATLQDQARRVVEDLANEIQQSSVSRLSPAPPALPEYLDTMSYQINTGYADGQIQWGAPITFSFQYANGEIDDNQDNNGNTLVDEGYLIRTQSGATQYITYYVKDDGFRLSLDRNKLRIYLALQNVDDRGNLLETSVETTVELKNPSPQ
jgi:prepilin-type N-terminal cleavage/methylation domain-containing protein